MEPRMTNLSKSEIEQLSNAIHKLNDHKYFRIHDSYLKMMFYQLLRGISFGLGSVLGATVVVSVVGFWLSQIEFIPLIGDWAAALAHEIMDDLPADQKVTIEKETNN
jgi:hypothetical protein